MKERISILPLELKKKWTEALRSGKYKQGGGLMYDGAFNEYCCLGVLESICGTPNEDLEERQIPAEVNLRGPLFTQEVEKKLMDMNDGSGEFFQNQKSFKEIADYIDKNL